MKFYWMSRYVGISFLGSVTAVTFGVPAAFGSMRGEFHSVSPSAVTHETLVDQADLKITKTSGSQDLLANSYRVKIRGLSTRTHEEILQSVRASLLGVQLNLPDDELIYTVPGKVIANVTQLRKIGFYRINAEKYDSCFYLLEDLTEENTTTQSTTSSVASDANSSSAKKTYSEPTGMATPQQPAVMHVTVPRLVDHVIFSFEEADSKMGSHSIDDLRITKPTVERSKFAVIITQEGLEVFKAQPEIRLPLLVAQGLIARPVTVLRLKGTSGIILPDAFGEDKLEKVSIFAQFSVETLNSFKNEILQPEEKWAIQYSFLTDPSAHGEAMEVEKSLSSQCAHLNHPGNAVELREFVVGLHRKYTQENEVPSLCEFMDQYGLANCEMTAIGAAQKCNSELGCASSNKKMLIASGSTPGVIQYGATYVDLHARNHAWNVIYRGEDASSFVSLDVTPSSVAAQWSKQYGDGDNVKPHIKHAVFRVIVQTLERMMQKKSVKQSPVSVVELDNYRNKEISTGYQDSIPKVVQYILDNHYSVLYSTALSLIKEIGDSEENRAALLTVFESLEGYDNEWAAFRTAENALRTQLFVRAVESWGSLEKAEQILASGKPFSLSETQAGSLIFHSILYADTDKVKLLKKAAIDWNVRNEKGQTPLEYAQKALLGRQAELSKAQKTAREWELVGELGLEASEQEFGVYRIQKEIVALEEIITLLS